MRRITAPFRELRHCFCVWLHGPGLDMYRTVYLLGVEVGLECRYCRILRT